MALVHVGDQRKRRSLYLGDPDRRLVRVDDPLEDLTIELWVLTHTDLRYTARVKAVMSFLFDFLSERRELFEGR